MVVEILVASSDAKQALLKHGLRCMANLAWLADVRQTLVERDAQAAAAIDFPEQEQACIGGDMTTTKGGSDFTGSDW